MQGSHHSLALVERWRVYLQATRTFPSSLLVILREVDQPCLLFINRP
jgi:hypothetical protein